MSFGHSVGKENKAAILFVAPLHMAIEPGNCGFLRKPFTPDAPRGAIGDCPALAQMRAFLRHAIIRSWHLHRVRSHPDAIGRGRLTGHLA